MEKFTIHGRQASTRNREEQMALAVNAKSARFWLPAKNLDLIVEL
jgi:hypothetical protein